MSDPTRIHPEDPSMVLRKQDHIRLAFESQVSSRELDRRFYYEPALVGHPKGSMPVTDFAGFQLQAPIWISSMTGGSDRAGHINKNLAKACSQFGLGMGLGSCRSLLFTDDHLQDFQVKSLMPTQPLMANLGIAQIEQLIHAQSLDKILVMVNKLNADGLFIHLNPLQEYLQPEGDQYNLPPIESISRLLDRFPNLPIFVKEVGQGMGPKSLAALMQLPLAGIEFAASGGTNFSLLELNRDNPIRKESLQPLAYVGHSAEEMINYVRDILAENTSQCRQFIISGGVKSFLDGYYYINKLKKNQDTVQAIYGQAYSFLQYAKGNYEDLACYIEAQIDGLKIANQILTIK